MPTLFLREEHPIAVHKAARSFDLGAIGDYDFCTQVRKILSSRHRTLILSLLVAEIVTVFPFAYFNAQR